LIQLKLTRLALENAASVAGTMLITECVITNVKKKDEPNAGVDPKHVHVILTIKQKR